MLQPQFNTSKYKLFNPFQIFQLVFTRPGVAGAVLQTIHPAIQVYKNKTMLVGVYLDKGRVSDTPESAETVISETPQRRFLNINKLTSNIHVQFTSTLSRYVQFLRAPQRKNISCLRKFSLVKSQCFALSFFLNP